MTVECKEKLRQEEGKITEWLVGLTLPHHVKIKNIRKIQREPDKITIKSGGIVGIYGIGPSTSDLDQLEAELNRLIK